MDTIIVFYKEYYRGNALFLDSGFEITFFLMFSPLRCEIVICTDIAIGYDIGSYVIATFF